jgi:hypothetical protein
MDSMQLAFFDHVLKGGDAPAWMAEGRVRLFDLGTRTWQALDAWPAATARVLHLGGGGRAAVRMDDGVLAESPGRDHWERLVHDPRRPAPAFGPHHGGAAWRDRSEVDARFGVACFTSAPVRTPLTLAGTPGAVLEVEADAPSFDVNATLSVVTSDGRSLALSQGERCCGAGAGSAGDAPALQQPCASGVPAAPGRGRLLPGLSREPGHGDGSALRGGGGADQARDPLRRGIAGGTARACP